MRILTVIIGILVVIGGIFAIFTPGATFLTLGWLLGLALVVAGVNSLAAHAALKKEAKKDGKKAATTMWDVISGLLTTVLGLLVVFNAFALFLTEAIMIYLFAAWLVVTGVLRVFTSFKLMRRKYSWGWVMFAGILGGVLGIYTFFHPLIAAFSLGYLLAFWILFTGINLIITALTLKTEVDEPVKAA